MPEVAVVGVPDEKWVEAITAFVVRKDEVDEAGIVEHVRSAGRKTVLGCSVLRV